MSTEQLELLIFTSLSKRRIGMSTEQLELLIFTSLSKRRIGMSTEQLELYKLAFSTLKNITFITKTS